MAFERKLARELTFTAAVLGGSLEHNPWFEYRAASGDKWKCLVPDMILFTSGFAFVIEAKLTYVPEAREKLRNEYVPIVRAGLASVPWIAVVPLVVVRNLTPDAGLRAETLSAAAHAKTDIPVLAWRGETNILW